jgi:hypothetical protein
MCYPYLLGEAPPKVELLPVEASSDGEGSKASEATLGPILIFDGDVELRLLVCTELAKPVSAAIGKPTVAGLSFTTK